MAEDTMECEESPPIPVNLLSPVPLCIREPFKISPKHSVLHTKDYLAYRPE